MAAVMIGVDPHKASHTAAAVGPAGEPLGDVPVRAPAAQAEQLLAWAAVWPERTWAVEGAAGLGNLLAQQLLAAGEVVLDVQPKVAARVRLLAPGNTSKNDPNDARPVAVAALPGPAPGGRGGSHGGAEAVDPSATGTWAGPGPRSPAGSTPCSPAWSPAASAGRSPQARPPACASASGRQARPPGPAASSPPASPIGLRRRDAQIRQTRNKLAATVPAPGTTLTGIFGAGPVIAAAVLGTAGNRSRFGDRDRFAAYNGTAPIEVSSGDRKIHRLSLRGNRRLNHAIHMAAVTQIRYKHSPGRAYFDRKIAEGKTGKEALRCLKRQISDAIYARLIAGTARRTPADANGPGGQSGNGSVSSAAGSHPGRRLFGQATPGPAPSLRPAAPARRAVPATPLRNSRRTA